MPELPGPCVVLANELLDNLPFALLERTDDGWAEVHVGLDGDRLVEVLLPAAGPDLDVPPGPRAPPGGRARRGSHDAVALAGAGGRVVAFDYASTTGELARRPWSEWVRTYRRHERGGAALDALGTQDITCEVAVDQLPSPTRDRSQADWLRAHGIDELVEEGRRTWRERAAIGDLAAIRARSRVTEAEAAARPERPRRLPGARVGGAELLGEHPSPGLVGVGRGAAGIEGPDRLGQVLGEAEHQLVAVLQLDRGLEARHLEVGPQHVLGHRQAVGAVPGHRLGHVEAARRAARRRGGPATRAPWPAPRRRRRPDR